MYDIPVQFIARFVLLYFLAALQPKALGFCIVAAVSMMTFYPNIEVLPWLDLFALPAYLLSSFRE